MTRLVAAVDSQLTPPRNSPGNYFTKMHVVIGPDRYEKEYVFLDIISDH